MAKRIANKGGKVVEKPAPEPLNPGKPLNQASKKMRSLQAEKLPVAKGGKLVGTLEGNFIDRKAAGFGHDPSDICVGDSMSKTIFYCFAHQSVENARKIMRDNDLQYLPVVDDDLHIVGMLALTDL